MKRLEKTKQERFPDLRQMREERDARERQEKKNVERERRKAEKEERERREQEKERRSYDTLFANANMRSNADGYDSDDFMWSFRFFTMSDWLIDWIVLFCFG